MKRSFGAAFLCAAMVLVTVRAAVAAPASADVNARIDPPPGITVEAKATARPTATLTSGSFGFPGRAGVMRRSATAFRAALVNAGVPQNEITLSLPGNVRVASAPKSFEKILALARANHAFFNDDAVTIPADFEATYRDALRQVIEIARARTEVIATTSHQHIGRLISFQPGPFSLAESMPMNSLLAFAGGSEGDVVADGLATFEILP